MSKHFRDKPVAATVVGFDESGFVGDIAQRAAGLRNGAFQHAVGDVSVRPDGFQQFVFGNHAVVMFNQITQYLHGAAFQRDDFFLAVKQIHIGRNMKGRKPQRRCGG